MYAAETNGDQLNSSIEEGISEEVVQKVIFYVYLQKIFFKKNKTQKFSYKKNQVV